MTSERGRRPPARPTTRRGEVVDICRDLIRIDTTNYGDDAGPGERKAAEYVAALLDEVGIESRLFECEPGRTSSWRAGAAPDAATDALLLHGHLDVVPAEADDWQVHPFSGEVQDGYVWGRGAVDMKDFDAMLLSVVRARAARRRRARSGRWCCASPPTRRPAATRAPQSLVERPPRAARGLHRGGRRGRRLQRHRPRPPGLPDRGRREGHGLDAADRPRPRRPRLDAQPRQRGHRAGRRGRADRRPRVAGAADPVDARCCWPRSASWPAPRPRRRTPRRWSRSSAAPPGCSARSSATPPTRRCSAPATRSTWSRPRRPRTSTAASCPATRTSSSPPSPSSVGDGHRDRLRQPASAPWRRRTTATWSTR